MNTSSHDFVTVDMRGLKAALVAHARAKGVSVSMVVREAVARAPEVAEAARPVRGSAGEGASAGAEMVKLSFRIPYPEAVRLDANAKAAGLSRGAYVSRLSAGVAALPDGPRRADQMAELIASNSELSSLSRDIRHLTALLAHGEVRAAKEYRQMLDAVAGDVHRHLEAASAVLGDLRPRRVGAGAARHSSREETRTV